MEQKRTLWILLATGIFLMVVLGFAMIMCAPSARKNTDGRFLRDDGLIWTSPNSSLPQMGANKTKPSKTDSKQENKDLVLTEEIADSEETASDSEKTAFIQDSVTSNIASPAEGNTYISDAANNSYPYKNTVEAENLTVISKGTTNIYGYGSGSNPPAEGTTTINLNQLVINEKDAVVVAQNKKGEKALQDSKAYVKAEEEKAAAKKTQASKTEEPKVVEKAPVAKNTYTSKTTATTAAKTASKPATKPAVSSTSATVTPDRFWVQAASFTSKKAADEARTVLDENKIQCEVFTFTDAKGNLFYRVRVGPYTTKTEAEYWKKRIDSIPMFAKNKSFVTNSSATAK